MSDIKATGGMGFSGWLTIVFIVLKLLKVINWPWIWVLSPLWIGLTLTLVILGALLIFIRK